MNVFVKNKLKDVCHEKGMSLRDLAKITGISRSQFSLPDMNLRLNNIALVLTALDCKFEDIFQIVDLSEVK